MSEAIENMDVLKTNLESLEESKKAADKIMKVYDLYNKAVLLEKLKKYMEYRKDLKRLESNTKELEREQKVLAEVVETQISTRQRLEEEQKMLDEQRRGLEKSYASEIEIKENLDDKKTKLDKQKTRNQEKQIDLENKRNRQIELERDIKNKKIEIEILADDINDTISEMDLCIEEMDFMEQKLMKDELLNKMDRDYDFAFTKQAANTLGKNIRNGIELLKKQDEQDKKYNEALEKYDDLCSQREQNQILCRQAEELLLEEKSILIEKMNVWVDGNSELKLKQETIIHLCQEVNRFSYKERYFNERQIIDSDYTERKNHLQFLKINEELKKKSLAAEKEEKEKQLTELENAKEVEPDRTEEVIQNRLKLKELGIPHTPFYKCITYKEGVGEEIINLTEEALFQMGILDALIVSNEYKEKVLKIDKGICDKYIFSERSLEGNISNILCIDNEMGESEFYNSLSEVLQMIGYNCESGNTHIHENGEYVIGVITGNVSGNYVSKYIGEKARERNRRHRIELLKSEHKQIEEAMEEVLEEIERLNGRTRVLGDEYNHMPDSENLLVAAGEMKTCEEVLDKIIEEIKLLEWEKSKCLEQLNVVRKEVRALAEIINMPLKLEVFETAMDSLSEYKESLSKLEIKHNKYRTEKGMVVGKEDQLLDCEEDIDRILYDIGIIEKEIREYETSITLLEEQLKLSDYEEVKEQIDQCVGRLKQIPEEVKILIGSISEANTLIKNNQEKLSQMNTSYEIKNDKTRQLQDIVEEEYALSYTDIQITNFEEDAMIKKAIALLEADRASDKDRSTLQVEAQEKFYANIDRLAEYSMTINTIFEKRPILDDVNVQRMDITCKSQGKKIKFKQLLNELIARIEEQSTLLKESDREIFEDILTNTVSKKISSKIYMSERWVEKMNTLMKNMDTSSGLTLSLTWKNKKAESVEQLNTNELVALLKKDAVLMKDSDIEKLAKHFRSKIDEVRKRLEDDATQTFHTIMREILDYRKWFTFQLSYKKTGENKKELTDREFFKFSGGEKAMSMYVPLFSAVVAKYQGAREDAPRLISLDEAFAGVDDMNIKDMFRLMVEFKFNFIINSQVLWGDYETVPKLAIYQLLRPNNVKYVTVIRYSWNGHNKIIVTDREE